MTNFKYYFVTYNALLCLTTYVRRKWKENMETITRVHKKAFFHLGSPLRTESAYQDIDVLMTHHAHLHNGRQPMEFVMSLASEWFKPRFMETFANMSQYLFLLNPNFDLR